MKTGCPWEFLPKEYPSYKTVNLFYVRAKKSGMWEEIMTLIVGLTRMKEGRDSIPTYGIVDSQSVKTTFTSEERGIDGVKSKRTKDVYRSRCFRLYSCCLCSCDEYS